MKTLMALMILVISLSFAGCATTQSGGAAPSAGAGGGGKSGKTLTQEDYDRMGIKEMEETRK